MKVFYSPESNAVGQSIVRPIRYIVAVGTNMRSCAKLRLLLKGTSFYCLVDCCKNTKELSRRDMIYTPDCVIVEIRSITSLLFLKKRIKRIQEWMPVAKVTVYYNLLAPRRWLNTIAGKYDSVYNVDDMLKQIRAFESVLER